MNISPKSKLDEHPINDSSFQQDAELYGQNVRYSHTRVLDVSQEVLRKNRILQEHQRSQEMTAYKMLRTQVLQRMKANNWRSLAITSANAGEGKTLTAINLALSLAKEVNHTVLLVDLDLRRPSVHRYFDYEPDFGLCDYLSGSASLMDIMINPGINRLVCLPGGKPQLHSSEMLSSPKMLGLSKELVQRYDSRLVLFDMPPVLATDDMLVFAPHVDAVLLVVEEGKTKNEDVTRVMEILRGVPLLGTVLNKTADAIATYY